MPTLIAWQLDDVTTTGPDPFPASNAQNNDAVGASTITIGNGSSPVSFRVNDNDSAFENLDNNQSLDTDVTFNGITYAAGEGIVIDYSYIIRPQGSSDPADNVTIYVLKIGGPTGDHPGFVSDGYLAKGVTYDIVGLPTSPDTPAVAYSSVYVCFAADTQVDTVAGPRAVQTLSVGDRLIVRGGGDLPLVWIGRREVRFASREDGRHPILIPRGSFGYDRPAADVVVSPQHRILLTSGPGPPVLVPALACTGMPGVRTLRGRRSVTYFALLLPRHAVIRANGLWAESFYPGPCALDMLPVWQRLEVMQRIPGVGHSVTVAYGPLAAKALGRRAAERLIEGQVRKKKTRGSHPAPIPFPS